jgi:hypothetical protein
MTADRARAWLFANWMYAGLVAALFLLALAPLLGGGWSGALVLTYLLLPIYMIHQVEEHAGDRFRTYFNAHLGGGREVLTTPAVVTINLGGVWLVYMLALYAAWFEAPGFGLILAYTTLINAILHIAPAAKDRAYNPGLVTAVVLFVPMALAALVALARSPGVGVGDHVLGLSVAILIHGAIIAYAKLRQQRLQASR